MAGVALKCEIPSARQHIRCVRADARALLKLLSLSDCELSVVLTNDASIRELNRAFRGKDRSTDVLSFPQFAQCLDEFDQQATAQSAGMLPRPLGDVVISLDSAWHQAQRLGVALESRLRTLLIHGVLHLLGYDHERSRAEARRMFARERELAAALGSDKTRFGRSRSASPRHTAGCL
jgi:rRNA maturation RNase YbeY